MQSNCESVDRLETHPQTVQTNAIFSEPWWRGIGHDPVNPDDSRSIKPNAFSLGGNVGTELNDGQPQSNEGRIEEGGGHAKGSINATSTPSGNCSQY